MKRMNHNHNKEENYDTKNQPTTDATTSTNNVHTSISIPLSSPRTNIPYLPNDENFIRSAGPGCHIAFRYLNNNKNIGNNNNNIPTNNNTATSGSSNCDDSTLTTTAINNTFINDWVLGWKPINDDDDDDYEDVDDGYEDNDDSYVDNDNHVDNEDDNDTELPELMIDPDDFTLALYNRYKDEYQIAYISIYDCIVYGRNHTILSSSTTTTTTTTTINNTDCESHDVIERTCTTLIVICPPYTMCILCYLPPPSSELQQQDQDHNDLSFYEQRIDSDIQIWKPHPNIHDFHSRSISFPLLTTRTSSSDSNSIDDNVNNNDNTTTTTTIMKSPSESFMYTRDWWFLNTFLYGNYHAIDFACTIGTPIIAVGNGIIINVKIDSSHITGIAVTNLFHWNSILLQLDHENDSNNHDTFDNESAVTNHLPSSDNDILYIEYVHIATSNVTVGQRVVEGEVIGTTGSVGFSPEPHLHISGYRSSDPITPTCGIYFHTKQEDKSLRTKFLPTAGQRYNEYGLVTTS